MLTTICFTNSQLCFHGVQLETLVDDTETMPFFFFLLFERHRSSLVTMDRCNSHADSGTFMLVRVKEDAMIPHQAVCSLLYAASFGPTMLDLDLVLM